MQKAIAPVLEQLEQFQAEGRILLLDAGCGTAASSAALAINNPAAIVVGVDRSAARLRRAHNLPSTVLPLRARLEEFWLLAQQRGIMFDRTYVLYPNPYPKSWHMGRRWYGHPVFPAHVATARSIEVRTNMQWYAAEFAYALELYGWNVLLRKIITPQMLTPFERKYAQRGEQLWSVIAQQSASHTLNDSGSML